MRFDNHVFDAAVSTLALDVIPEIEQVCRDEARDPPRRRGRIRCYSVLWWHARLRPRL
jgi:hypothetical protein